MSEGITCYEQDEELCTDEMCLRAGCRLRNSRLAAAGEQKPVAFMFWNEPDTQRHFTQLREVIGSHWSRIEPLYAAPQPAPGWDEATGYAERLSVALWGKHYKTDAPQWEPFSGDLIGILTQIDNMTCGLSRSSQSTSDAGGEPIPAGGWSVADEDTLNEVRAALSNPVAADAGVRCANCRDPLFEADAPLFCGCCREMGANSAAADSNTSECDGRHPGPSYQETDETKARLAEIVADRTADVTEDDLVRVIKGKANVDFGGWENGLARAILDIYTVGRR